MLYSIQLFINIFIFILDLPKMSSLSSALLSCIEAGAAIVTETGSVAEDCGTAEGVNAIGKEEDTSETEDDTTENGTAKKDEAEATKESDAEDEETEATGESDAEDEETEATGGSDAEDDETEATGESDLDDSEMEESEADGEDDETDNQGDKAAEGKADDGVITKDGREDKSSVVGIVSAAAIRAVEQKSTLQA